MTEKETGHGIKVINAGNCMLCGRKITIGTCKEGDKLPNIFFCPRFEKRRVKKDKPQESEDNQYSREKCYECCNKNKSVLDMPCVKCSSENNYIYFNAHDWEWEYESMGESEDKNGFY